MVRNFKISKNCVICNKQFFTISSDIKRGRGKCCSKSCATKLKHKEGKFPKILTAESNPNWKGGKPKCINCGNKVTSSQSKKCGNCWSIYMKTKIGENNHKWIKDRTQLKKSEKKHLDGGYREWMFAVKKRDGWICRIADVNCDGRLEAHHIKNWKEYPELRYEITNGITLCHAHHPMGRAKEKLLSPYFQGIIQYQMN